MVTPCFTGLSKRCSSFLTNILMAQRGVYVSKPKESHTASLIFLHGLGDTGAGWCESFEDMKPAYMKVICPTAPAQPVTLNMGMVMPSWFDIIGLSPDSPQDEPGIKRSCDVLRKLIEDEKKLGIPNERIVIGGFSQGGAVAMYTGFSDCPPLAGMVLVSSWMPLHQQFPQNFRCNTSVPILQCHGTADPLVPFLWGQTTGQLIKSANPNHEFKAYENLGHSSSLRELKDIKAFLEKIVPRK